MIAYTFTQQYLVYLENTTHTSTLIIRKLIVVIYLVLSFIMLILLDRNIRATIQSQLDFQKDIQLSHLKNYNKQIENLYQSVRSFRHDYANILTTLKLGIEQNDMAIVKEVYDSVLKDSDKHLKSKTFDLTRLINIEDNTIKSLLAAKFLEAEENNIDVSLDIPKTIKLEGMEMVDFITVISIFLDNAMEARFSLTYQKCILATSTMVINSSLLSKTRPGKNSFRSPHFLREVSPVKGIIAV